MLRHKFKIDSYLVAGLLKVAVGGVFCGVMDGYVK